MTTDYSSLKEFKKAFPWGSECEIAATPKYKSTTGTVVGWIWNSHSYGIVLDNDKWADPRSYAPHLLTIIDRKGGKK